MRSILFLLFGAMAFPALAATYKWVDEKGITHYGDTIPPQYVNQGVTEINTKGQVIRKTDPALTPAQIKAHEEDLAKQKETGRQSEDRRRRDVALVGTYTTEQEIDLARDRNTRQIDGIIGSARERLVAAQGNMKQLADQLEFYQGKDKAGKPRRAPAELLQEMEQVRRDQSALNAAIAELEKQKIQIAARFDEDRARFREIKLAGVGGAAGAVATKAEPLSTPFSINPSTQSVVNGCIARWSDNSYYANNYAVSAELVRNNEQTDLVLDGRVQGRTGQFIARRMVCSLTSDGKIDPQGTDIKKALASLGAQY